MLGRAGAEILLIVLLVGGCSASEEASPVPATAPEPALSPTVSEPSATSTSTAEAPGPRRADDGPTDFSGVPLSSIGLSIPAECPGPWLPEYAQDEKLYPTSIPPDEVRPAGGTPLDLMSRRSLAPDTDGDGTADEQLDGVDEGMSFALRRGDGDLILAIDGGVVGAPGGASWLGDLDGDGRDEILLFVADSSEGFDYPLFAVPGTTPAGRHDPRVVGTRLPAFAGMPVGSIGDWDGDGNDDLLLPGANGTLAVVSGEAVMDATGEALDHGAAPLAFLPSDVRGTLLLGDDRPVPVRVTPAEGDPTGSELVLLTDPAVVLRTDRVALPVAAALTATITGFENEAGRYVQLDMGTTRSGTRIVFVWNLDDPCAGPTTTS